MQNFLVCTIWYSGISEQKGPHIRVTPDDKHFKQSLGNPLFSGFIEGTLSLFNDVHDLQVILQVKMYNNVLSWIF